MKRILPGMSLLIMIFIVSCTLSTQGLPKPQAINATETLSPDQAQTQISQMLTVMPTATMAPEQPVDASPTPGLPTVEIGGAILTATSEPSPTAAATEAEQQAAATATTAPADTPVPTATTAPQGPTATLPPGDPRARLGAPKSTDPMDNDTAWIWPTGADQFSSASFANGTQVITSLDSKDGWRLANPLGRDFSNTYLEATFKTGSSCAGADHYGIMLRVPVLREPDQGYMFGVSCDGKYSLRRWNGEILPKGEMKRLVEWTASTAIKTGPNQTNRLGIYAVGKRLILYVNGTLLTEVQDATYPSGYFGVFIGQSATKNFSVQLDEMSYWENPQP